jgi:hypothetical protein
MKQTLLRPIWHRVIATRTKNPPTGREVVLSQVFVDAVTTNYSESYKFAMSAINLVYLQKRETVDFLVQVGISTTSTLSAVVH